MPNSYAAGPASIELEFRLRKKAISIISQAIDGAPWWEVIPRQREALPSYEFLIPECERESFRRDSESDFDWLADSDKSAYTGELEASRAHESADIGELRASKASKRKASAAPPSTVSLSRDPSPPKRRLRNRPLTSSRHCGFQPAAVWVMEWRSTKKKKKNWGERDKAETEEQRAAL